MNRGFVTLLTNDQYAVGVALLKYSLNQVQSKYPLYAMVTPGVSKKTRNFLASKDINLIDVPELALPKHIIEFNNMSDWDWSVWKTVLTKFNLFKLTQFDKVIFLDADLYFVQNVDDVFEKPDMTAAEDGECYNLWGANVHFNSGFFVCEPSEEKYNSLMEYTENLNVHEFDQVIADQEILNHYYKDWPNQKELHLSKYYNVFPCYLNCQYFEKNDNLAEDVTANVKFYHFVGAKPWYHDFALDGYTDYIVDIARNINAEYNKVAMYAICKNEIKQIDEWLKMADEADYICILDTGSTDGTWEKLQSYQKTMPKLIIKQEIINPWRFDTARNKSIELVPDDANILCCTDIDERYDKSWVNELKKYWTPKITRADYIYRWNPECCWNLNKVHSRDWKWKGLVHEYMERNDDTSYYDYETLHMSAELLHYRDDDKPRNYLSLMKARLEETEHPGPLDWFQLAMEASVDEIPLSIKCWNTIVNSSDSTEKDKGMAEYKLGQYSDTENEQLIHFLNSANLNITAAYLQVAIIFYNSQQWNLAIYYLEEYKKRAADHEWIIPEDKNLDLMYDLLSICYCNISDYFKAFYYISKIENVDSRIAQNKEIIGRQLDSEVK